MDWYEPLAGILYHASVLLPVQKVVSITMTLSCHSDFVHALSTHHLLLCCFNDIRIACNEVTASQPRWVEVDGLNETEAVDPCKQKTWESESENK
jgi:hypothetical protein